MTDPRDTTDDTVDEGMATHEQSDLIEAPEQIQWMMDIYKIDTVQSRAQIEALRTIAEELHELNHRLSNAAPVLERMLDRVRWEGS